MAATTRELHYRRSGAVVGDLALEREVRERELNHAGEARREAVRPKVRRIARVQVRERQRVSVGAVLGFAVVAVMAVFVLMGYVQLTEMSSGVVDMKAELTKLSTENVTLTAQYQKLYDQSTVKSKAEAAGMTKPSSSQIHYVDLSGGDSAVVYDQKDTGVLRRLISSLHNGIYAVVEYFD